MAVEAVATEKPAASPTPGISTAAPAAEPKTTVPAEGAATPVATPPAKEEAKTETKSPGISGAAPAKGAEADAGDKGKGAAEGGKKKEGEVDPLDTVPETYEAKLPEGVQQHEGFKALWDTKAKEAKLTQRQYTASLETFTEVMGKIDEQVAEMRTQQIETWKKDLDARKEFVNGSAWANVAVARDLFAAAHPEDAAALMGYLKLTGLDHNPQLVQMLEWFGRQFGEGRTTITGKTPAPAAALSPQQRAAKMFPNTPVKA